MRENECPHACMHEHEQFSHSHYFFSCFVPLSLLAPSFSFFLLLLSGLNSQTLEFILLFPSAHQSFPLSILCLALSFKDKRAHISIRYIFHAVHALAKCFITRAPIFCFCIYSEVRITKLFSCSTCSDRAII